MKNEKGLDLEKILKYNLNNFEFIIVTTLYNIKLKLDCILTTEPLRFLSNY